MKWNNRVNEHGRTVSPNSTSLKPQTPLWSLWWTRLFPAEVQQDTCPAFTRLSVVLISRLSWLLLLALRNGTENKGSLDVESVSLGLFLFVVRLAIIVVIIVLHVAVVGSGMEGGRRRGRHRVGPRVAEALRLRRHHKHLLLLAADGPLDLWGMHVCVCVCLNTHEAFWCKHLRYLARGLVLGVYIDHNTRF